LDNLSDEGTKKEVSHAPIKLALLENLLRLSEDPELGPTLDEFEDRWARKN